MRLHSGWQGGRSHVVPGPYWPRADHPYPPMKCHNPSIPEHPCPQSTLFLSCRKSHAEDSVIRNSVHKEKGKSRLQSSKASFPYTGRPLPSAKVAVVSQGSRWSLMVAGRLWKLNLDNRLCVQPVSKRKLNFMLSNNPGSLIQTLPSPR